MQMQSFRPSLLIRRRRATGAETGVRRREASNVPAIEGQKAHQQAGDACR